MPRSMALSCTTSRAETARRSSISTVASPVCRWRFKDAVLRKRPSGHGNGTLRATSTSSGTTVEGVTALSAPPLAHQAQTVPYAERVAWCAVELRNMHAYMGRDLSDLAAQVTCPTLVLHGSDDRMVYVAWGERLAQVIPTARLHVVAGGGHGLVHRTEEGRRIAIEYITEQEARRQTLT